MNVWIDLANSPHVQITKPVIRRLREEGHDVWLTRVLMLRPPSLLAGVGRACSSSLTAESRWASSVTFLPRREVLGRRCVEQVRGHTMTGELSARALIDV
jgi:Protein of unknown function (DUF354)